MLAEKRRRDHAQPIVHPARCVERKQRGIDDRIACRARGPCVPRLRVVAKRKCFCRLHKRFACDTRGMHEQLVIEVAPYQLAEPCLGVRALCGSDVPSSAGTLRSLSYAEIGPAAKRSSNACAANAPPRG